MTNLRGHHYQNFEDPSTTTTTTSTKSSSLAMKKLHGCELETRGLNYTINAPTNYHHPLKLSNKEQQQHHQVKHILKNVSLKAKPWEVLAIVGPSGAGKSTLLEMLAGKLHPCSGSSPSVFVNHVPIDNADFKKISGYVAQKDTLFPLLTVGETLMFSAKLRLRATKLDLQTRVESLMRELGLSHVANVRVGDDKKVRGISGGERRRVSIGVEVVHDPRVLILDEPTSGLDSSSALQIVDLVKAMAESSGRTVVLSIHQPGFRIVKLFNSVVLLSNGSVLHHGTVDQLHSRLVSAGLHIPPHVNVVEFAIDSIQLLQQQQQEQQQETAGAVLQQAQISKNRCTLQQLFQLHKIADEDTAGAAVDTAGAAVFEQQGCSYANSFSCETAILAHRFAKTVFRTKELFLCRTIQMLLSGLVIGSIFFNLGDDATAAREHVGLFAFVLTFLLSSTTEALPIFLQEREILAKETSSGSYRVSSYVVANGLVFLPFLLILAILFSVPLYWLIGLNPTLPAFLYFLLLIWLILYTANSVVVCFGALASDFIVGNSMISGVMGSFFLFSGYFITKRAMPSYWLFMHYVSLFKYPFEGFLANEFAGKCLEEKMGVCLIRGDEVLREVGLGDESRWRNVMVMVCYILAYRFFSYLILRCRCSFAQRGGLKRVLT